jgi:hypothetical protein
MSRNRDVTFGNWALNSIDITFKHFKLAFLYLVQKVSSLISKRRRKKPADAHNLNNNMAGRKHTEREPSKRVLLAAHNKLARGTM